VRVKSNAWKDMVPIDSGSLNVVSFQGKAIFNSRYFIAFDQSESILYVDNDVVV
jgi:hypothetical protein